MSETSEQLYAPHEPVFPKRVKGTFRTLKWWIMGITLGIYYLAPWIRWDRGPSLPDQAILVDLANRRFFFFWIEIWPHEFYFIAGLLIMAGLGLFLFTSAAGRVWCGYACPQTVWTDLFILVERWVEGDRNARLRLHRQAWNGEKIRKRCIKFTAWTGIALATGGAWVFYFADAPTLLHDLVTLTASPIAYSTVAFLTATTFFFGGIAREQICIYACPWPRIQAAMVDENTITIAYRDWRGEARGRGKDRDGLGDCIDCNACVAVCPMGIDIRDGQQMECITCGLCIDACNGIMDKVGQERGLIGYLAYKDETQERAGKPKEPVIRHLLRPRTILYSSLWALVGLGLVVALFIRPAVEVTAHPVRNPTYVTLSDGAIRNTYIVGVRNRHGEERPFHFALQDGSGLTIALEGTDALTLMAPPDTEAKQRVYVMAPAGSAVAGDAGTGIRLWVVDGVTGDRAYVDTVFNGQGQR